MNSPIYVPEFWFNPPLVLSGRWFQSRFTRSSIKESPSVHFTVGISFLHFVSRVFGIVSVYWVSGTLRETLACTFIIHLELSKLFSALCNVGWLVPNILHCCFGFDLRLLHLHHGLYRRITFGKIFKSRGNKLLQFRNILDPRNT